MSSHTHFPFFPWNLCHWFWSSLCLPDWYIHQSQNWDPEGMWGQWPSESTPQYALLPLPTWAGDKSQRTWAVQVVTLILLPGRENKRAVGSLLGIQPNLYLVLWNWTDKNQGRDVLPEFIAWQQSLYLKKTLFCGLPSNWLWQLPNSWPTNLHTLSP